MADAALASVPNQVGTLVADLDGTIISSTGELAQATETAMTLRSMLQDASKISNNAPFQRLEVTGKSRSFLVTVADNQILAVAVKTEAQ